MRPPKWDRLRLHTQPGGAVVATVVLDDGRCLRICGAKAYRGCSVAKEMMATLAFEGRQG